MKLTDKEIVTGILDNNEKVVSYFFYEECTPIFSYVISRIFDYQVEKDELINELYIYLQENDWQKLRQFNYRSRLTTWLRVVATRFFQKKRAALIENESSETLIVEKGESFEQRVHTKLDLKALLEHLPNSRYRLIIKEVVLEDKEPQEVADKMQITIDNLYNIKRRALLDLARLAKEGGYDVR